MCCEAASSFRRCGFGSPLALLPHSRAELHPGRMAGAGRLASSPAVAQRASGHIGVTPGTQGPWARAKSCWQSASRGRWGRSLFFPGCFSRIGQRKCPAQWGSWRWRWVATEAPLPVTALSQHRWTWCGSSHGHLPPAHGSLGAPASCPRQLRVRKVLTLHLSRNFLKLSLLADGFCPSYQRLTTSAGRNGRGMGVTCSCPGPAAWRRFCKGVCL